jgi:hypothetical protein
MQVPHQIIDIVRFPGKVYRFAPKDNIVSESLMLIYLSDSIQKKLTAELKLLDDELILKLEKYHSMLTTY